MSSAAFTIILVDEPPMLVGELSMSVVLRRRKVVVFQPAEATRNTKNFIIPHTVLETRNTKVSAYWILFAVDASQSASCQLLTL